MTIHALGGKARAAKLSAERRREIASAGGKARAKIALASKLALAHKDAEGETE